MRYVTFKKTLPSIPSVLNAVAKGKGSLGDCTTGNGDGEATKR